MPYSHLKFAGQAADEKILYFSKRHWVHFLFLMLRNNTLGLIAGGAIAAIWYLLLKGSADFEEDVVLGLLTVLVLLLVICTSLLTWTIWYLTVTIVTNRRLVKVVQKGLFYHYLHEVKLSNLQDITHTYSHPVQYIFNYGSLVAQVASGAEGKFSIKYLPNPKDLHHYINKITGLRESGTAELPPYFKRSWGKRKKKEEMEYENKNSENQE